MFQVLRETVLWVFKKLDLELSCDPAIPLLSTHPKGLRAGSPRGICTSMFTAALFTIAKGGSRVSISQGMDKQDVVCPYNGMLLNLRKEGNSDLCYSTCQLGQVTDERFTYSLSHQLMTSELHYVSVLTFLAFCGSEALSPIFLSMCDVSVDSSVAISCFSVAGLVARLSH